jgi:predicted polyphosphate/ATP-dependent NAD kinase
VARSAGFEPVVVSRIETGRTTAEDTQRGARVMQQEGVDLLLFAGGDGTARDVYEAVGLEQAVLGIPAGVKIHSAVYATTPRAAGDLAREFLEGRVTRLIEAEVMDVDEESFRQGRLAARLYGYLRIPQHRSLVQSGKVASASEESALASIAHDVIESMEEGWLYILGPGTTTRAIAQALGLPKTLLGVDVVLDGELAAEDANETTLLALLEGRQAKVVVTPIGGQGALLGRGNQQISPQVLKQVGQENLMVVSTRQKLYALGREPLWVDTGDPEVDAMLSGYVRVITGYRERSMRRVEG